MEQKIKEYVARISQATPIDLSIISSEVCITYLDKVVELIKSENFDKDEYNEYIYKVKEIIMEKIQTFDRKEKMGRDLTHIFLTVNQLIAEAQFAYNKEKFIQAKELIKGQMEIFKIAKQNKVGENNKVINTSEKIIAGLTYSKGGLNEFIDDTSSKTFNA